MDLVGRSSRGFKEIMACKLSKGTRENPWLPNSSSLKGLPIGMHRGSTKTHPLGTANGDRSEELTPKLEGIWAQERAD